MAQLNFFKQTFLQAQTDILKKTGRVVLYLLEVKFLDVSVCNVPSVQAIKKLTETQLLFRILLVSLRDIY